jgi:hypothetical protein
MEKESTAYDRDPKIFLKSIDSSEMYKYTIKHAALGTTFGLAAGASVTALMRRYIPPFRRYATIPIQSFFYMAGAAAGFTISSDWALVRYYRYHDRPEISGFARLASDQQHRELMRLSRLTQWEQMKDRMWDHRFKLIFAGWLGSMTFFVSRDMRNPHLNTVHKFGHARIYAQAITLAAVIAAFAFNSETGPWAEKYKNENDRADERR